MGPSPLARDESQMFDRFARWLGRGRPQPSNTTRSDATSTPGGPACETCSQPRTTHISRFRSHSLISEKHLCDKCAENYLGATLSYLRASPSAAEPPSLDSNREVEIQVETIIISEIHEEQIIVFRELGGPREFPIVTGIFEATAIDRTLRRMACSRPLTFEAWQSTLKAAGARVRAALIRDREESMYFADLRLTGCDGIVAVDMRPSDAVHLAIIADAPILIPESLLVDVTTAMPEPS
jgi:uncharacterized protein